MTLCKVKHHHYNHRRASVEPTLSRMKTNLFNNTAKDALKLTSHSLFESRDRSHTTCVKLCVNTHKQKHKHTKTHTNKKTPPRTHTHKHKHTHTHTHTNTHTNTNTHIQTRTHTHTHKQCISGTV